MARDEQYLQFEALERVLWRNHMNIKALITTLVVGSSSMASADSLTVRGSVSVSLGSTVRPTPRPVVVHEDCAPVQAAPYRPASSRPIYQPINRPIYRPTLPVVVQPVWQAPVYNPTNVLVSSTASQYTGAIYSQPRYFAAPGPNAWFDLSEATRIEAGREFFKIGANKGSFRGLRLEALGNGHSKIDQVTIEFADAEGRAKHQVVKLDSWIGRGNSTLTIDLDGNYRQITRVIVYGATEHGSAYKLMAL